MRCFWQLGCTVFECEFVDDSVALNVKRLGIPSPDARPDVTVSRWFPRAHGDTVSSRVSMGLSPIAGSTDCRGIFQPFLGSSLQLESRFPFSFACIKYMSHNPSLCVPNRSQQYGKQVGRTLCCCRGVQVIGQGYVMGNECFRATRWR